MTPVKLVVLAVLFYVGYRLLRGIGKKKSEKKQPENIVSEQVEDVLVEDPVCHTLVPKGQAIRLQHDNQLYFFCSEACCSRFISDKGEKK
ncbi:MAG: YHS domain-containing [Desulfobulbaceae bacterium]|nr:MAG: YHS domain-containing [Desulfobulbaceae bacterium]